MTTNFETLARRAVACKHWRWMPGMVTTTGVRILRRDDDGYTTGYGPRTSYCVMQVFPDALPDLSDPATLGCLLAIVREAHADPQAHVVKLVDGLNGWQAWGSETYIAPKRPTEAEAIVSALEAAP